MSVRVWRTTAGLMLSIAATMGIAACGSSDTDASDTGASADASSVTSDFAVPTSSALSGAWSGTWQSVGETKTAQLGVVSDKPFLATIDIPGRCGATWKEKSRTSSRVIVTATVTYGDCSDNEWSLAITSTSITATDTADPETTAAFTRK